MIVGEHEHCWHMTNQRHFDSGRIETDYVCCHCGKTKQDVYEPKESHGVWCAYADKEEHGPFAPHVTKTFR